MTDAERLRLGEERMLIFRNFCNGVPVEELTGTFRHSALEIEKEILFVARKIREYRFRRLAEASKHGAPPLQCDTLHDIRINRLPLMETLAKLGPVYLSSDLLLPKIAIQKLDHPGMLLEASHRMKLAR